MTKRRVSNRGATAILWLARGFGLARVATGSAAIVAIPVLLFAVSHSPYRENLMNGPVPQAGSAPAVLAWCGMLLFIGGVSLAAGLALILVSRDGGTQPSLLPRIPQR